MSVRPLLTSKSSFFVCKGLWAYPVICPSPSASAQPENVASSQLSLTGAFHVIS
jgi:hypothetical protein